MKKSILSTFLILLAMFFGCTTVKSKDPRSEKLESALRVYIFNCGENDIKDISAFAPGSGEGVSKKFAVPCYVIKHPKGNLLWDAGLSDEIAKQADGVIAKNGNFHFRLERPFLEQLKGIGLRPEDFTYIAFSHFHSDHVGNANAFKDATLLIQEEEYNAAFGEEPAKFGFDPKIYEKLKNSSVEKLRGDFDVFQDGSVIIKRALGHTPGHQVLFVNLNKTGPVLISGDLYHFTDNRTYQRVPSFNFDKEETLRSMKKIEDFLQEKKAVMWIEHDYEQNQTLRHAPLYYE